MKFAVLAFIASLCLVAVTAEETTGELMINEEDTLHYDLNIIKRIRCVLYEIQKLKEVCQDVLKNIKNCRCDVKGKVKELVDTFEQIVVLSYQINETCKNSNYKGKKCIRKIRQTFPQLYREVEHAVKLINEIRNYPENTSKCVLDAIRYVVKSFAEFPDKIKACHRLHMLSED